MALRSPLVTVVVPTYNHENYVLDCLLSIVEQDYPNIELIVINDGSTDSTDSKIKDFIEQHGCKFRYISKQNEGVGKTVNLGLTLANGKYFCEVCSDDMLLPESISKRVDYMEAHSECDAVFANGYIMKGNLKTDAYFLDGRRRRGYTSAEHTFEDYLKKNATIVFHTGMTKTSFLRKLGGFDEDFYSEDVYMRYLILRYAIVAYLNEPVLYYRLHETNISKDGPLWIKWEKILALEKLYAAEQTEHLRRVIKKYLFKACLRYVKAGIGKGENRGRLLIALGKAVKIRPFSFKALYYMVMLRSADQGRDDRWDRASLS